MSIRTIFFAAVFVLAFGCEERQESLEVAGSDTTLPSFKVIAITDGDSIKIFKDGAEIL